MLFFSGCQAISSRTLFLRPSGFVGNDKRTKNAYPVCLSCAISSSCFSLHCVVSYQQISRHIALGLKQSMKMKIEKKKKEQGGSFNPVCMNMITCPYLTT